MVVAPWYEADLPIQSKTEPIKADVSSQREVPKVVHHISRVDNFIPPLHHDLIHFVHGFERTITVLDDVGVIEVVICSEEDVRHAVSFLRLVYVYQSIGVCQRPRSLQALVMSLAITQSLVGPFAARHLASYVFMVAGSGLIFRISPLAPQPVMFVAKASGVMRPVTPLELAQGVGHVCLP